MLIVVLLILLLAILASASAPVSLEANIALGRCGVIELKNMACSGNPEAAAKIGWLYLFGNELLGRDLEKAKPFLRFGAESGTSHSAADLAIATNAAGAEELQKAAKWAKVARYVDGEGSSDVVVQLVNLAAAGNELTEGVQRGARWIQLYFMGKINRRRVCVLYEKGVELPSDYYGVVYIGLDNGGAWRYSLAKELKGAGLEVDLNRLRANRPLRLRLVSSIKDGVSRKQTSRPLLNFYWFCR